MNARFLTAAVAVAALAVAAPSFADTMKHHKMGHGHMKGHVMMTHHAMMMTGKREHKPMMMGHGHVMHGHTMMGTKKPHM